MSIKNISRILVIFLPNILIGFSISALIIGVVNQVYLYNHLKLLALQAEVKANQQQVSVLNRNLTELVAHQPTTERVNQLLNARKSADRDEKRLLTHQAKEMANSKQQTDITNQLLSQRQVDHMLSELQLSQTINLTPAAQILNKLKKLQLETALFFKAQLVDEEGSVSFETPLADEPDKARQVAKVTTVQTIRQIRLVVQKEKIFDRHLQSKFLDFITLYETVAVAMVNENKGAMVKLEALLRVYQAKILELLNIQSVEDYQYDTYLYWVNQLQKIVEDQAEEE